MLVQNVQTNSVFASGIFSVSGEKLSGKADKAFAFSALFNGMNKTNTVEAKLNPADNSLKTAADGTQSAEVKTTAVSDVKQSLKNIKGRAKDETVKTDGKANTAQNTEEFDETEFEKISTCLVNVVVTVVEFFNITPEELQVKMDGLGMNASDLADPDSLKQLFVSLDCDNDISKLLTDQNLLDSFEDLMNEVTGILDEFGVTGEMIANAITSSFGDENNFKLDLLGNKEEAEGKPEDRLKVVNGEETMPESAPVEKEGDDKKITIEFNKSDENRGETHSDRKKNSGVAKDNAELADRFVNNMLEKFRQNIGEVSGIEKAVSSLRGIADQILNQIKINLTADIKSLEIQLSPEHLGKVNVQIQENDGVITAKFHTENQLSKEAIESNIIQFKETLREQGIKVDSVEVAVSDFSFTKDQDAEKNGAHQNESKGKRHFTLEEINEKVDGTDLRALSYIDDGTSTVNYVA